MMSLPAATGLHITSATVPDAPGPGEFPKLRSRRTPQPGRGGKAIRSRVRSWQPSEPGQPECQLENQEQDGGRQQVRVKLAILARLAHVHVDPLGPIDL